MVDQFLLEGSKIVAEEPHERLELGLLSNRFQRRSLHQFPQIPDVRIRFMSCEVVSERPR